MLYFDALGGDGVLPSNGVSVALERDFGSIERWNAEFTGLAKAMGGGSGWALSSWSSREERLVMHWAADHTHLLGGATPILALDMYEHAYHLDFGAKAATYVDTFMKNIRWDAVYRRYQGAVAGDSLAFVIEVAALSGSVNKVRTLDVRRVETFARAADTIVGAAWRDPAQLPRWSAELDAGQALVVFCVHGHDVSRSAALDLRARGFDARYLAGGIEAWRAAGLPLQLKGEVA